jgi:hypothetical protein
MPAGRPPKFKTPEDMQQAIDEYFAQCDDQNPPLISGLAYHLDMATESLRRYGENDEFSAVVKKAKQRVEIAVEKKLHSSACTGSIFWLKNNAGYKDKTEQELSGPDGGPIKTDNTWTIKVVDA